MIDKNAKIVFYIKQPFSSPNDFLIGGRLVKKTIFIALFVLLFSLPIFAQPEGHAFEYLGTVSGHIMAYDTKNIVLEKDTVEFYGFIGLPKMVDDKVRFDERNYVVTRFIASCSKHTFKPLRDLGYWNGVKVNITYKAKEEHASEKESFIYIAIEKSCRSKGLLATK